MPVTDKAKADELRNLPYLEPTYGTPSGEPHNHEAEVEYDNLIIAEMRVKGYPYSEIADKLDLTVETVYKKWYSIRSHWRRKRLSYVDDYMNLELEKLQALEDESWQAYRRSSSAIEYEINNEGQAVPTSSVVGVGDPRFLAIILKCMQDRARRLGLYATDKKIGELADNIGQILTIPENADSATAISAVATAIERLREGSASENQ